MSLKYLYINKIKKFYYNKKFSFEMCYTTSYKREI